MPGSGADPEDVRKRAQSSAPIVWLLGKTGAGKTAIVAALTGDPRAEIGEGFEPCTRTAVFYDVPPEVPLLRFLDTRGLGEADYDPANDIAWCEGQSHLLLMVMQVADPAQHAVLRVLQQARRRHPDWPVIVAQTGLHRLYPAGVGPIPIVGVSSLAGILAIMLRALAIRYAVAWTPGAFAQFSGAIGGGAIGWWTLRYGFREVLKLIPMVGAMAAGALNAAAAFGVHGGMGGAPCVLLALSRR